MKIELKEKKEIEVTHLQVKAGVRYWEDAEVNGVEDTEGDLIPCREGDYWCPVIDVETGIITNWEQGKTAETYYKVCDDGEYSLLNHEADQAILTVDGYVPDFLSINDDGYGDYIIMSIDENGKIKDWKFDSEYFQDED